MSDKSADQTRIDLSRLNELASELGDVIKRQRQGLASTSSTNQVQNANILLRLATQINIGLDNLQRSLQTLEKEREQFRAMQEVGAIINSSLDRSEVLNSVMDSIISLTGAERGFLMLFDEDDGELKVEVARNIKRETIEESSFEISRSIVSSVADSGEPVVTTNAQADPRFAGQESIISYNLRSILCVPLKIKENIIGVIYADNQVKSGIFLDSDRDLLAAFANQAAVAIENARLFRQIRDQLADITEMKNLQDDVFESIASGVITIDLDDQISLYNRAAEQILGVPTKDIIERDYRTLLNPSIGDVAESIIEDIQARGGNQNLELDVSLSSRPGTVTLNLTFSPLRDMLQQTLGVALVLNDISEKKRLESVRRYLPPALVDQVRDVDLIQQAQRRDITVLFADIRGFTTWSENLEPELIINVINGYLTVAANVISFHEGLIDKYGGDAVMALFNAPLNPQEDHVERAVMTALDMRDDLGEYNSTLSEEHRLYFGVGIHAGHAVVGNVGSPMRKDYSAMGDAVNLAERLQVMAKPNQILISENTFRAVQDWVEVRELESVRVKGRQARENIYELLGRR